LWSVPNTRYLKIRVPPETKARIAALSKSKLLNESIWVRQAIEAALRQHEVDDSTAVSLRSNKLRDQRICLRLQHDDRLLLEARAAERGMRAATYASVLMRAHLRDLAPLPAVEMRGLTRSVAELSAMGRNLNQIAQAINRSEQFKLPGRQEVLTMLKICEALRDFTKDLIKTNNDSWRVGHARVAA
jgi:predicted DNA-binding protein